MPSPGDQDAEPPRLVAHFDAEISQHASRWDELYREGYIPWDRGLPSPALADLLAERRDLLPSLGKAGKKALVPGCGKGYDVLLLSSWGYDAYGLDISEKAVEEAKMEEKESAGKKAYELKDGVKERGKVTWLVGDFFEDRSLEDVEGVAKFDLIYDYTFSCALPPYLRSAWSKRITQLLACDGRLVCLEFPTYKSPKLKGPPWGMPPKIYLGHLQRPGQDLPYNDEVGLLEDQLGPPAADVLRRIAHFQPPRTHPNGYDVDGKMTDWIGVWAHVDASE